jgi:hypothetical protein
MHQLWRGDAGQNNTPLFLLFQAFRRSSPKPKVAGCYAKLLVVKDNAQAEEMAWKFYDGVSDFQPDTKWYELVEEEDRKLLREDSDGPGDDDPIITVMGSRTNCRSNGIGRGVVVATTLGLGPKRKTQLQVVPSFGGVFPLGGFIGPGGIVLRATQLIRLIARVGGRHRAIGPA